MGRGRRGPPFPSDAGELRKYFDLETDGDTVWGSSASGSFFFLFSSGVGEDGESLKGLEAEITSQRVLLTFFSFFFFCAISVMTKISAVRGAKDKPLLPGEYEHYL